MPEKVTPEERLISLAIEKAREVKEAITEANGIAFPIDDKVEMEKVKRPKAQKDTSKIDMQTEEGFGLGGAEIKKEVPYDVSKFYVTLLDYIRSLSNDVQDLRKFENKLKSYENSSRDIKESVFTDYNGRIRDIRANISNINEFKNSFEELPESWIYDQK